MILYVIYQDPCGSCAWCSKTRRVARKHHIILNRISFVSPYAKKMLEDAKAKGWQGLPVITDGEKFSDKIEDFLPKKKKASKGEK